jgi:hypothetical protein
VTKSRGAQSQAVNPRTQLEKRVQPQGSGADEWIYLPQNKDGTIVAFGDESVLLFISDRAEFPQIQGGQEIWVEVTLPAKGPPRPIRMGIKKDGVIVPVKLDYSSHVLQKLLVMPKRRPRI